MRGLVLKAPDTRASEVPRWTLGARASDVQPWMLCEADYVPSPASAPNSDVSSDSHTTGSSNLLSCSRVVTTDMERWDWSSDRRLSGIRSPNPIVGKSALGCHSNSGL
jgi:hypothetical protein